jgi:hypothetical protein
LKEGEQPVISDDATAAEGGQLKCNQQSVIMIATKECHRSTSTNRNQSVVFLADFMRLPQLRDCVKILGYVPAGAYLMY